MNEELINIDKDFIDATRTATKMAKEACRAFGNAGLSIKQIADGLENYNKCSGVSIYTLATKLRNH